MKSLSTWLFCAASLLLLAFSVAGQSPQPAALPSVISLNLISLQDSVKIGSPIKLQVVMVNRSASDIDLMKDAYVDYYWVEVVDDEGHRAPLTKVGDSFAAQSGRLNRPLRPDERPREGSMVFINIKSGGNWTQQIEANRFYELSKPGKYVIHVEGPDPKTFNTVKSNLITITVTAL